MGYDKLQKFSLVQLARRIQRLARTSSNVFLTDHSKERMIEREINYEEVMECLRIGTIHRVPEPNFGYGTLECLMERNVLGRDIECLVALSDEQPDLIVVTVW
ncbi:MAG: DUF4258 domain-containing protein [Comamonas sp.]|nr:DUF4258 domain-containing protein [Comamonas sp.]